VTKVRAQIKFSSKIHCPGNGDKSNDVNQAGFQLELTNPSNLKPTMKSVENREPWRSTSISYHTETQVTM